MRRQDGRHPGCIQMHVSDQVNRVFVTFLAVCILHGCATVAPTEPNAMARIADQTSDLMAQTEFQLQLSEAVLLNPYLEVYTPRVDQWDEARAELAIAAQAIVAYSVNVLRLAQVNNDEEQIRQLIPLLRELDESLRALPTAKESMTHYDIDSVLSVVAEQNDFLRALRRASGQWYCRNHSPHDRRGKRHI